MHHRLSSVVALVAILAACTVNPVTGRKQLDLLGEAQEVQLGASLYPQAIQGSLGPADDPAAQALVQRVGEAVAAVGHRPSLPYEFTAVNDPSVNAFALPGGKICITRGLLERLESEDGLAAVLGHEVGHVTARHAVAAYNRQLLAGAVMLGAAVYVGSSDDDSRALVGLGALLGTQLALAHYSREQERQSDELGLDYAVKAGYSPLGMIETQKVLLQLRQRDPGLVERLFASHPMSAERLATAEKRVASLPADVRARQVRGAPYRVAMAKVIAERPAWDLAETGLARLAKDQAGDAEAAFAKAAKAAPAEGVLHTLHAAGLTAAKRTEAAAAEAREGARLAPRVFVSQLLAARLLVESDPRAALGQADAAEKLLADVADVAYLRGRALEKLGRRGEAVQAYREAVRRDPSGAGAGALAAKRLQALGEA